MEHYLYRLFVYNSGLMLAAAAGISRYRSIDLRYKPFVWYIILGFINELLSLACSIWFKTTVINNNLFMLLELIILNLQFEFWAVSAKERPGYRFASVLFCAVYLAESVITRWEHSLFYFSVLYCFYLVMCGTRQLAAIVLSGEKPGYKNPEFIVCCGIIFYFCLRIIIEAFWLYGLHKSSFFRNEVYVILMCVNLFVNILYLYATLWIPKKPDYITYYG